MRGLEIHSGIRKDPLEERRARVRRRVLLLALLLAVAGETFSAGAEPPRQDGTARSGPVETIEVKAPPFEEPEDITAFATIVETKKPPAQVKTVPQALR